jgi:hypothetical protein
MKKQNPSGESKQFFERIENNAFCIDSKQIISFLDQIENNEIEPSIHSE